MQKKIVGYTEELENLPLVRQLERFFHLSANPSLINATRLRQREIAVGLISPLDYAREGALYAIIPGIAVSSLGGCDSVMLYFREGLQTIGTIAVNPADVPAIVLATIVLAEEFELQPSILPMEGSLDEMLARADAALLTGTKAYSAAERSENKINLVEAWNEMTRLPFVHGLFCSRENELSENEVSIIQGTSSGYSKMFDDIIALAIPGGGTNLRDYLESFSYEFTDETESAIVEFYRYAYYRGILPDIPELRFFSNASEESNGS